MSSGSQRLTVERIVYRVVRSSAKRNESFLPSHGFVGLGDGLGLVLNRVIKGPTNFRATRRTVVGLVVEEDEDHVTIERNDGRRVRIPVEDIIERKLVA